MKKKKKLIKVLDRINELFKRDLDLILLIIGFIVTLHGLFYVFILGFHTFDTMQNLLFMEDHLKVASCDKGIDWEPNFYETTSTGRIITFEEGYRKGLNNFVKGVWITMLGVGLFGYAVGQLHNNRGVGKPGLSC